MAIKQSTISIFMTSTFIGITILLATSTYNLQQADLAYEQAVVKQAKFKQLGLDLAAASDYLTDEARKFSVTTDIKHLNNFWAEINITRTRDKVLEQLKILQASPAEFALLELAKQNSDALVATETRSMRLVLEVLGYAENAMPPTVAAWNSPEDQQLSDDEKLKIARDIMFDAKYHADKDLIMNPITEFQNLSNANASKARDLAKENMRRAEQILFIVVVLILIAMLAILWILHLKVNTPIKNYTKIMLDHESKSLNLTPAGTFELITLAEAFNQQINTNQQLIAETNQASLELNEQNWQKSGQTQLNEILRGEQSVNELAKNIIDFITNYINADLGSFYLYKNNKNNDQPYLERIANYGCVIPEHFPHCFKLGEGLVGQAGLKQKTIIRQPQADELHSLQQSSFCIALPRYVIFLPFFYELQLKGVIEIGSYQAVSDKQCEFLELSMISIGISIASAESRQKMQQLLKQSQAQAQQLTIQQEELKSANEELQAQQEELRQANEELEIKSHDLEKQRADIQAQNTSLEQIQREIKQKAHELELASRYKSEFLANMSHELRTPLNAILVLGQMLADNDDGNLTAEQIDFAQTIHGAGEDLLNLINEVLDLSKIEAGKVEVNLEDFSLFELINKSIEGKFKALASKKDVDFQIVFEPEASVFSSELHSDPHRIKQIISNLLSNAIKFTDHGQVIMNIRYAKPQEFAIMLEGKKYLLISVTDSGIGIPMNKHHAVFEAFRQADSTTSRKYGGTGLGLAISRRLAQLLGGDIYLRSEEWQGSTFSVLLLANMNPVQHPVDKIDKISETDPDNSNMPVANNINNRAQFLTGKKVLLVDDDERNVNVLAAFLNKQNMQVKTAHNGNQALDILQQNQDIDIVLMDIMMPEMDGYETMQQIRLQTKFKTLPIIALTAKAMKEDRAKCIEAGANDYLTKPLDIEKLLSLMKVWLYR